MSGDHTAMTQSRSSTGALVTGLTEKLNQKRIKSAMDFTSNSQLADLQITNLLGEGGFAKVFRGLWQVSTRVTGGRQKVMRKGRGAGAIHTMILHALLHSSHLRSPSL